MRRLRFRNGGLVVGAQCVGARETVGRSGRDRGLLCPDQPESPRPAPGRLARIKPLPGQLRKAASVLQGLPEIVECDRITGEDCFIAHAYVRSVEDLERLIDEIIPYATTNTSIIQSSPVERRLPPILARNR